jgi:methylase of polypeptide subunit release factors
MFSALRDGGWEESVSRVFAGEPDDAAPGLARQYVFRIAEQPLLAVSIQAFPGESSLDSDKQVQRWSANLAYNHHAQLSLVITSRAATLLLTDRYLRPSAAERSWGLARESIVHDPAQTYRVGYVHADSAAGLKDLAQKLRPEALASGRLVREADKSAHRQGYERRTSVDQVLLDHFFRFRAEVLRADERDSLGATERAHFDATLVSLITRILFVRHLEDHGRAGWYRGRLLEILGDSDSAPQLLAEVFAGLHGSFDSELYPAARPHAYRVPALTGRLLRQLLEGLYCSQRYGVVYDFKALEGDSLGLLYQQVAGLRWPGDRRELQLRLLGKDGLVPERVRERFGIYYTPDYAVDALLDLSLGNWLDDHSGRATSSAAPAVVPRILDLAAGSGVFLARAYRMARRRMCDTWPSLADEWIRNLHGADVDARAVALARFSLWMEYSRDRTDATLPSLARTIRIADSLLLAASPGSEIAPLPDDWIRQGFDVIVGNPPFLSHMGLGAAVGRKRVAAWRTSFRAASKETNLAAYFVERALGLLRPGGYLGMVVPRNLIKTESGEALRRILRTSCEVVAIVDFLDADVFEDATAAAALVVVRRPTTATPRPSVGIGIVLGDLGERPAERLAAVTRPGSRLPSNAVRRRIDLDAEARLLGGRLTSGEAPWVLESDRGRNILRKLFEGSGSLGDYMSHSYAMDEGLRGAFLLTNAQRTGGFVHGWSSARSLRVEVEARWVRDAIQASHVGILGRLRSMPACVVIYPYVRQSGAAVPWETLRRYPRLASHLEALQLRLVKRRGHGAADGWWVPRAVRKSAPWHIPSERPTELIIMRRHGAAPQVAVLGTDTVPSGNVVAWIPRDQSRLGLAVATALLSSTLWWWIVQLSGTVGSGKLYRLSPSMFARVSIPDALVSGERLVRELTSLVSEARKLDPSNARRIAAIWESLDDAIFEAYGLGPDERRHVRKESRVYAPAEARSRAVASALGVGEARSETGFDLFRAQS